MYQQQRKSTQLPRLAMNEKNYSQTSIEEISPRQSMNRRNPYKAREDALQALAEPRGRTSTNSSRPTSIRRSNSTKRQSFWSSSNPDDDQAVPPMPTAPRRKYVPRSAAKSFLATTCAATEEKREGYRRSMQLEQGSEMVCMTDEQAREWAKLMAERKRADSPMEEGRFVNEKALAALEFGEMR